PARLVREGDRVAAGALARARGVRAARHRTGGEVVPALPARALRALPRRQPAHRADRAAVLGEGAEVRVPLPGHLRALTEGVRRAHPCVREALRVGAGRAPAAASGRATQTEPPVGYG